MKSITNTRGVNWKKPSLFVNQNALPSYLVVILPPRHALTVVTIQFELKSSLSSLSSEK